MTDDDVSEPSAGGPAGRRWCLILNGKAAGDEPLRAAVAALRDGGIALNVRLTWESGDAARHVKEAIAAGVDTVVAGGGDGTLSEVAGALADRREDADRLPGLGLVPLGTANDFATAAGIPADAEAALALILATVAQPVDLLRVEVEGTTHWCANVASGGFGTQVTVETDEGLKKILGGLAYLITGVARLGRIEPIRARLTGPEFRWEGDFIALGVGNGRQAGGGQALCPDARVDDGKLDVTVVPELTGEVGATLGALVAAGKEAALERVAVRAQLPWVEIEAAEPMALNLDGEPVEARRFHVGCVGARIRMHLPPGCPLLGLPGDPLAASAAPAPSGRDPLPPPLPA